MAHRPHHTPEQHPLQEPFFLIGAERSGTTLLRLMLDHHPEIRFQYESNFLVDHLTADGGNPDQEVVQKALALDRGARLSGFEVRDGHGYKDEVREFLARDARGAGKPIYGAAIHRRFADALHIWPAARFLHLVRDPRDVAPSVIAMGWAGNSWCGSKLWLEAQEAAESLRQRLPPERWLTLRFEDLVTEPIATLTRVCQFLGCSFDAATLTYPQDTTYPAPDASAAERWKQKLAPNDIQWIEACVGPWLQAGGYEPSGEPALVVGSLRRRTLRWHDRLGRIQFRIRQQGLFTVLGLALSSRLGMQSTHKRMLLRVHEHENSLLR